MAPEKPHIVIVIQKEAPTKKHGLQRIRLVMKGVSYSQNHLVG